MGLRCWDRETYKDRADNSVKSVWHVGKRLINGLEEMQGTEEIQQVLTYVHPEKNDPARYAVLQKNFIEQYLIDKVATKEGDTYKRIPLQEAESKMRLTFLCYSYGGYYLSHIRGSFAQCMQELGYSAEEQEKVFAQVLQINMGASRPKHETGPLFSEINLVGVDDSRIVPKWYDVLKSQERRAILIDTLNTDGAEVETMPGIYEQDPHQVDAYLDAVPKGVCSEIRRLVMCESIVHPRGVIDALISSHSLDLRTLGENLVDIDLSPENF